MSLTKNDLNYGDNGFTVGDNIFSRKRDPEKEWSLENSLDGYAFEYGDQAVMDAVERWAISRGVK